MSDYQQQLLIAGMGKTGRSIAEFLSSQSVAAHCCDDQGDYVPCTKALRDKPDYIFKSPGLRPDLFLNIHADTQLINDVELLLRLTMKPVILVTGTNGKSTVVTLLESLLIASGVRAVACGNNGVPVLDTYRDRPDMYIVELSSYQLENMISIQSMSAVVLNVGVDHVDRYTDIQHYQMVKEKIYENAEAAVVPVIEGGVIDYRGDIVGYRANDVIYKIEGQAIVCNDRLYCHLSDINLIGQHNYLNVCATLALLHDLSLDKDKVISVLRRFEGLPHRMELVCEDDTARRWINDSKSTNVHSTRAALISVQQPVTLIMGGRGKGEDYSVLFDEFAEQISQLVLYGEDAGLIEGQASAVINRVSVNTVSEAVACAAQYHQTVLFSPACASFDQYHDFNERGEDFRRQAIKVAAC